MERSKLEKILKNLEKRIESGRVIYNFNELFSPAQKALNVPGSLKQGVLNNPPIGFEFGAAVLLPPCAIPLWVTLSGVVVCVWKHWFSERKLTIVRVYPENKMALEYARTFEQLYCLIILNVLDMEGGLSPDVSSLAEELSLDTELIVSHWEKYGDDPLELDKLKAFDNKPLFSFGEDVETYNGDFPVFSKTKFSFLSNEICSYELHERFEHGKPQLDIRDQIDGNIPIWLKTWETKKEVFDKFLSIGDYKAAWFTLCSSGWKFGDAKEAINQLIEATDDIDFKIVMKSWLSQPFKNDVQY